MINIEKAKTEFIKYTDKFDKENEHLRKKIEHSIRVMGISKQISTDLKLSREEIELSTLIGLLHDIGRFEQYTKYCTFKDYKSIDHGKLGVEILEKEEYIRKFIEQDNYDEIIKKAIKNHNQYGLEERLNERELLFCKLIKDADKIDILYEGTDFFWNKKEQQEEIENSTITEEVWKQFKEKRLVENQKKKNALDNVIGLISFIHDINFKESLKIIKENNYINKILDRFEYKNEDTKNKIEEIKTIVTKELNRN